MKKALAILSVLLCLQATARSVVEMGEAYLVPLQQRDSILIADQVEYGFELDNVREGTDFQFIDFSRISGDTLSLVRNWRTDTLSGKRRHRARDAESASYRIRASVILAPFEEGTYQLPDIVALRTVDGESDTLVFAGQEMEVKTLPVDTATFEIHDIKGQMRYPLTLREAVPYVLGFILLATVTIAAVCLVMMRRRRQEGISVPDDPPYIIALRKLDKLRGDRYWAPEKQKILYSGITETLRAYIEPRFGINAEEMTTAEIFSALKSDKDITPDLYNEVKDLFETADFIKFAKHTVSDDQNSRAVPAAVRFVTATLQADVEEEGKKEEEK